MSTDSKRDQSTDRMLRGALRQGPASAGDACVDAETLAAWAEGALPETEAHQVEAHLADCARCQMVVAAFAATEPEEAAAAAAPAAPRVVVPFRPRTTMQTLKWLVPAAAGTIAATLLVWTAWPRSNASVVATNQTMAKAESATPPSARALAPTPTTPTVPEFGPTPPSTLGAQAKGPAATKAWSKSTATLADQARKEQTAMTEPTLQMARQTQTAKQQDARADATAKPAVSPQPTPAAPPPSPQQTGLVRTDPPTVSQTASADFIQKLPGADRNALNFLILLPGTIEFGPADSVRSSTVAGLPMAARAAGGGGGGRGGRGGSATAATAAERVVPEAVRWRVLPTGEVGKSIDGGKSWTHIPLDPPVAIVNGAAPSATVCWLVGRGGVVLLTTDGNKFTAVTSPAATDLRSVIAIDARQATVTAADGRVFTTTDGGLTWK